MNKSSFFGLLLALLLPFSGYFFVKYYSTKAVVMPKKYYLPDSVATTTKNGKTTTDTVWHKVKNIPLVNQFGEKVSVETLKGKIVIANTIFTRCGGICPKITQVMKRMQDSFSKSDTLIQFVSFSVDPVYDSVQQLRKFADRFNANGDNWWFVTGNKKEVYNFLLGELKASVADTTVTPEFVHTDMFFLLDKNQIVRGFYHALKEDNTTNDTAMAKLARDVSLLIVEKDKNKPSFFRNFIPILPTIFVAIAIVFVVIIFLNRKKN